MSIPPKIKLCHIHMSLNLLYHKILILQNFFVYFSYFFLFSYLFLIKTAHLHDFRCILRCYFCLIFIIFTFYFLYTLHNIIIPIASFRSLVDHYAISITTKKNIPQNISFMKCSFLFLILIRNLIDRICHSIYVFVTI